MNDITGEPAHYSRYEHNEARTKYQHFADIFKLIYSFEIFFYDIDSELKQFFLVNLSWAGAYNCTNSFSYELNH